MRRCGSKYVLVDKQEQGWTARCNDCRKQWPFEQTHFQGETMTCVMCGREQQSDPAVRSDWRCLEVDGQPYYVCPDHFPPDGSTKEAFSEAYQIILRAIMARQSGEVN
jgi:hypothetical protein